jgi:hypothetical protein
MGLVSVITAAHGDRAGVLAEAGECLAEQELPAGWELEWMVQEDGASPGLSGVVNGFSFGRYAAHGERLGIAMTRNVALARAGGELLHVLDSDDLLLPGALRLAIEVFERYPEIHWVAAQADDLMPDGTWIPYPLAFPVGFTQPGALSGFTIEHGEPPVSCAGLSLRTSTVRALGGWIANPCSEDVAMLAAVAELTPGYITPEVTWLIRQHDDRTTRTGRWGGLRAQSMEMVRQRIAAIREVGLTIGA